jgi:hypothetical protein
MTDAAGSGKPIRRDPNRRVIDITCTVHGARRCVRFHAIGVHQTR